MAETRKAMVERGEIITGTIYSTRLIEFKLIIFFRFIFLNTYKT